MQLDTVSESDQRVVARVAGAVAHDLNNPLQGILSLLAVTLRECRLDQRCQLRLEQIQRGVSRMSRTVESLATVYENLPRPLDCLPTSELLDRLATALSEREIHAQITPVDFPPTSVVCFAPETARLAGNLLADHANGSRTAQLGANATTQGIVFRCETAAALSGDAWLPLEQMRGVSGIAVLLNEIVRLSRGAVEYRMGDSRLDGIQIFLPTA